MSDKESKSSSSNETKTTNDSKSRRGEFSKSRSRDLAQGRKKRNPDSNGGDHTTTAAPSYVPKEVRSESDGGSKSDSKDD